MSEPLACPVSLTPEEHVRLESLVRAHSMPQALAFRCRLILRTGKGAHGLNVSRDSKVLYVSNRGEGSISVVDFATRKVVNKWRFPRGGSPDRCVHVSTTWALFLGHTGNFR